MSGHLPHPKEHTYDVVVVGAGGAGLRAAVEAAAMGAKTALICKSLLGKAHTVMAEGGVAAALSNADARDNWRVHFRDTMRGGKFLNNWRMAQIHAQEAPERVRELERWGAVFDRTSDGWISQRNFGGHQYPRLAHVGDRTGLEIIRALQDKGVHSGIDVFMEYTVTRLLKDTSDPSMPKGRIAGCLAYERESGVLHLFNAKTLVLACGGMGKAFQVTSNSWEYTGDGYGLAYEAGADLMDLEFLQFHPTGMVWPYSVRGILVTEGVRGEGGILRNSEGERFMFRYVPEMFKGDFATTEEEAKRWLEGDKEARRPPELLTRDVVARAIMSEVRAGKGSPHGGVFLDISWRDADYVKRKLPSMYHQFKELAGVDITKEAMEVGPTMHYTMGGVRVDPETQMTAVPGLFAAGETAAGLHGANRLGGNSLSDLLVFGKRAGEHAARAAKDARAPTVSPEALAAAIKEAMAPLDRTTGELPSAIHEELQATMDRNAGMIRYEEELAIAISDVMALQKRYATVRATGHKQFNPGWHLALDLRNMLVASEAVARMAKLRQESRGGHTRGDYPETDKGRWSKVNIVARKGPDGAMQIETVPLPEWPADVRATIESDVSQIMTPATAPSSPAAGGA
ncbi:MAG TPA: fumarate reductase/succinate dehydrogenase flavoprotein subunit [Candidatus Thermoplasmatota archaeon]|nr:fumarate reductase/succinate dehydrogenase flavoprotein subunit [Candidatus Thermoplasmatota archaeon]